jgi:hypothetical protein
MAKLLRTSTYLSLYSTIDLSKYDDEPHVETLFENFYESYNIQEITDELFVKEEENSMNNQVNDQSQKPSHLYNQTLESLPIKKDNEDYNSKISYRSYYSSIDTHELNKNKPKSVFPNNSGTSFNLHNLIYDLNEADSRISQDQDCISTLDKYNNTLVSQGEIPGYDLEDSFSKITLPETEVTKISATATESTYENDVSTLNDTPDYEQIYRRSSPDNSLTINEEFEQRLSLAARKYRSLEYQYNDHAPVSLGSQMDQMRSRNPLHEMGESRKTDSPEPYFDERRQGFEHTNSFEHFYNPLEQNPYAQDPRKLQSQSFDKQRRPLHYIDQRNSLDSRQLSKPRHQNHAYRSDPQLILQNGPVYNQIPQFHQQRQDNLFTRQSYQPKQVNRSNNGAQDRYSQQPLKVRSTSHPMSTLYPQKTGSDLDAFLAGNTNVSSPSKKSNSIHSNTSMDTNPQKRQSFQIPIDPSRNSSERGKSIRSDPILRVNIGRILENAPIGVYAVPSRTASLQPRGEGYNY